MFLYEKTHRYLKNNYPFFDALKTKDHKIRGNCNLLTKVKFHELEWSSPLNWVLKLNPLNQKIKSDKICLDYLARALFILFLPLGVINGVKSLYKKKKRPKKGKD